MRQYWPSQQDGPAGDIVVGALPGTAIARNVPYEYVYKALDASDAYHVKLVDGGLLQLQYTFTSNEVLSKQRLAYFPNLMLNDEDAPYLYERDELYGDILAQQLVRFPVRIDFAPADKVDLVHPATHLTLGQYESCRIPVLGPVGPMSFGMFVVLKLFPRLPEKQEQVRTGRGPNPGPQLSTISPAEKLLDALRAWSVM